MRRKFEVRFPPEFSYNFEGLMAHPAGLESSLAFLMPHKLHEALQIMYLYSQGSKIHVSSCPRRPKNE